MPLRPSPFLEKPPEKKKRQPTPEELGLIPPEDFGRPSAADKKRKAESQPAPAPKITRQPTPEELGFEDAPELPAGTQPSPEDLGIAQKPMGTPAPANDDSWEAWWNWAQDRVEPVAQEAGETADWLWDNIKTYAGYEEEKRTGFKQDTSRRVERPDMGKDGGYVDWAVDQIVPDFLYDFFTSKRTQKDFEIGFDTAQYAFGDFLKGGAFVMKKADEGLRAIGIDLDFHGRSEEEREATWAGTIKFLDDIQKSYGADIQRKSAAYEQEYGPRDLGDALVRVVPALPTMLAQYGLAGFALGPVAGFAFVDGMVKAGAGGSPDEVLFAAVKGAALGKLLEWSNVLSRPLRIAPIAGAGYGLAKSEGADEVDAMASGITFGVLGVLPKSGPVNVRYLREHGVMPDIRDIGGHVRDLFIGGNEPMAKRDFETSGWALKQIRTKHNVEQTQEMQMWQDELAAARKPREGDTETSVQDRVAEANSRHEQRLEGQSKKQFEEELPFRQAHDHADRRYRRAQHPFFGVTWREAPYMRSLHMYERDVVTTNLQSATALQKINEQNEQQSIDAKARADELRRQAEDEPDEVVRRRMNQQADMIENETFRMTFERRVNAEDATEFALEMSEMRAASARYELVRIIEAKNKVEGRRAMQMATERDLGDAYRAGVRKVARGNRRARELLETGDRVVNNEMARMKRDGITEDNPQTQRIWQERMEELEAIRENYRGMASLSLWENQSAADMRISFARSAWEMAHNPEVKPGTLGRILEILGLRKPRAPDEVDLQRHGLDKFQPKRDTSPEDAKKDGPDGWDAPPKADPVKPAKGFEQRYKALMEHSLKDPKLGKIQDQVDRALQLVSRPEDVLPMINFVASKNHYDPPSRRGIQTAKLRKKAAESLGMTSEEFLNSPYGKAFSDFELEAVIMIMDRQWARTQHAYALWRKTGSNNAYMAYQAELYRFMMIWERLRGAAAESGRSLRMFREIKGKYGSATRPLSDLEYKMIMSGDGTAAMKMMEGYKKSGFMGMLMEYYINNLLSGPQTAMVNIYSGASMLFIESIIKPAGAAFVGLGRYGFYMLIGRHLAVPFRKMHRAYIRGFGSIDANKKLDVTIENERWMPGNDYNTHAHRVRLGEVGARIRGLLEGIVPATVQFFRTLFLGEKFLGETNWAAGYGEHIPWYLGGPIIRIPGKILGAIDDFFKVLMYRSSIRGHAYRLAMAEYHYTSQTWKGLRGRRARYNELAKNPQGYVEGMARNEALRVTFQQTPDPIWGGIPEMVTKTPLLRILVPFTKTLLNSLEWVMSGTPMGMFVFRSTREALLGRRGRAAQDLAIAHVMLVTGASTAVFMWALGDDNVMPPYPKDEKGKVIAGVNTAPPLSIRIPGTDDYIQLNRVDPMGAIISLGSAAANAYKMSMQRGDTKKAQQAWDIFLSSMFSMVADRSGFRGLLDFLTAAQGGTAGNQPDAWSKWADKLGGTMAVPNVIASWARTRDPVIRRADGLIEQIMNRLPGEREKLPPVRNLWGDMVIGYDSYGENDLLDYTNPIYWGKRATDPATKMMLDLHKIYNWAPGFLDRSIAGRELTPEEYDYYQTQRGKYAHPGIREIAESPEYQEIIKLRADIKATRKEMIDLGRPPLRFAPGSQKRFKELQKQLKVMQDRLQRQSYKVLLKAKDVFRKANSQARSDTAGNSDQSRPGMFPDIWKRPKRRDDFSNPGEIPEYDMYDWLDSWMHADGPMSMQQEWDAEESKSAEEFDGNPYTGGDPVTNRSRAQHQRWQEENRKWIEETRRIQAINADRMRRGQAPLPLPPKPEPVQ